MTVSSGRFVTGSPVVHMENFLRFILLFAAPLLAACSAIDLYQQNTGATRQAETAVNATVAQVQATAAAEGTAQAATADALLAQATAAAQVRAELQSALDAALATSTSDPGNPLSRQDITSATVSVFGSVPVDSDRLNTIAALAFDRDGHLLVASRAGEIYRLIDGDGDAVADETQLIFQDAADEIGQVSALLARSDALLLISDGQLHRLTDDDSDSIYEGALLLSSDLPQNQNPLLANNSIVQSPDGRLFTADVHTGEILQIVLH